MPSKPPATGPASPTYKPFWLQNRLRLLLQIPAALAILAWVPGNTAKLAALLLVWLAGFRHIQRREAVFYALVCVFFTGMNAMSLRQGIFAFAAPDVLGMPVWELFMWGFYLLHSWRVLGGPAPQATRAKVWQAWILALLYAAAFGSIADGNTLLVVTAALLLAGLALFHETLDLAYAGYLVLLGAAFEYNGVHSGLWSYPGHPPGGVPLWFITLWGGVGLFMRRLIVPLLAPAQQ